MLGAGRGRAGGALHRKVKAQALASIPEKMKKTAEAKFFEDHHCGDDIRPRHEPAQFLDVEFAEFVQEQMQAFAFGGGFEDPRTGRRIRQKAHINEAGSFARGGSFLL